jgi:hypothetical protein
MLYYLFYQQPYLRTQFGALNVTQYQTTRTAARNRRSRPAWRWGRG